MNFHATAERQKWHDTIAQIKASDVRRIYLNGFLRFVAKLWNVAFGSHFENSYIAIVLMQGVEGVRKGNHGAQKSAHKAVSRILPNFNILNFRNDDGIMF